MQFLLFFACFWLALNAYGLEENPIHERLRALEALYPKDCEVIDIGSSHEGAPLKVLRVGPDQAQSIYINGAHHGDEPISALVVLALAEDLLRRGLQPTFGFSFFLQPIINPDGLRKSHRLNAEGVDLNRAYSLASPPKEIQAVKAFFTTKRPIGALAVHAGMHGVLWPLGSSSAPIGNEDFFKSLAKAIALPMGALMKKSYDDYPTMGEFIDYAYSLGSYALTIEVSTAKAPPLDEVPFIINQTLAGIYRYVELLHKRPSPQT